jgi:hypothetical protein
MFLGVWQLWHSVTAQADSSTARFAIWSRLSSILPSFACRRLRYGRIGNHRRIGTGARPMNVENPTYQMRQGQRTSKIVCIRAAATIRFVKCFIKEFAVQYV